MALLPTGQGMVAILKGQGDASAVCTMRGECSAHHFDGHRAVAVAAQWCPVLFDGGDQVEGRQEVAGETLMERAVRLRLSGAGAGDGRPRTGCVAGERRAAEDDVGELR